MRNTFTISRFAANDFHYHLHVVYVPVVEKEILWSKRCKDPELVGTVKETVTQVSHSKKWPRFKDEQGHWVNSYSLLQDRFHEHMKGAGYIDFERGERGSTAEHLTVLEYKTQQEAERAAALAAVISERQETAAVLDKKVEKSQERLSGLNEKISVKKQAAVTFSEIEGMGAKRTLRGDVAVSPADWETVSGLAKTGVVAQAEVINLKRQLSDAKTEVRTLKTAFDRLYEETKTFREAVKSAPGRVMDFLRDIINRGREQREAERAAGKERKGKGHDR